MSHVRVLEDELAQLRGALEGRADADEHQSHVLTEEHGRRLIAQLRSAAGPAGIHDDDLISAVDQLYAIAVSAGVFDLWNDGELTALWVEKDKSLKFEMRKIPD